MGRLLSRDVAGFSSYCLVGLKRLQSGYWKDLGVFLLVGHFHADQGRAAVSTYGMSLQSACCSTDTDANVDARARKVVASSAYNSSDIRKSPLPAVAASKLPSFTKIIGPLIICGCKCEYW